MDDLDDRHRITITPEHYHMARVFMVSKRLRSARIAVQRMIEIVAEHGEELSPTERGASLPEDDQRRRNGL